jgi:hypothetical protein
MAPRPPTEPDPGATVGRHLSGGTYDLIPPHQFDELGIDPADVLVGTFAAFNHPDFLPTPSGGNAYGLGIYETLVQPALREAFEGIDYLDPQEASLHWRRLNEILKSLGLLTRYARTGQRYYLIPHQVVARTLADVQFRAHQVENHLRDFLARQLTEHLTMGLIAPEGDLLAAELIGRFPDFKLVVLDSPEALQDSGPLLDVAVLIWNPFDFARAAGARLNPGPWPRGRALEDYVHYLLNLIHNRLVEGGELLAVLRRPLARPGRQVRVRFKSLHHLKGFLAFTHLYRTVRRYQLTRNRTFTVDQADLESYLAGPPGTSDTVRRLLEDRSPEELTLSQINRLEYADLRPRRGACPDFKDLLQHFLRPLFTTIEARKLLPEPLRQEWSAMVEVEGGLPETMIVFRGEKRRPPVDLRLIQTEIDRQGLGGCPLPLVGPEVDSFGYLDRVLDILSRLEEDSLVQVTGSEWFRFRKPIENTPWSHPLLSDVWRLVQQRAPLTRLAGYLAPWSGDASAVPIVGHLTKLALYGLDEALIREVLLIIRGHTTLTRVTVGKMSEETLAPLTDQVDRLGLDEVIAQLRIHRLMSIVEATARAGRLDQGQVREMIALYDDAVRVAAEPGLNWKSLADARMSQAGGVLPVAVRRLLKLFNLFDHLDTWMDLMDKGPHQIEVLSDDDPGKLARLQATLKLVNIARRFHEHYYPEDYPGDYYFFSHLLSGEFHGTGDLLPVLGSEFGFILLWIAVGAAGLRPINFNPLVRSDPANNQKRLAKLTSDLAGLGPQVLAPGKLAAWHTDLARGRSVFVAHTGLRMSVDPDTGSMDVSYIDAGAELKEIDASIGRLSTLRLDRIPADDLCRLEKLLTDLRLFFAPRRHAPSPGRSWETVFPGWRREMERLTGRMRQVFVPRLLEPGAVHTNIRRFAALCPRVLGFLIPQLGPVPTPTTDAPQDHEAFDFSMTLRCLGKFEALISGRPADFQDLKLLHLKARQAFGPDSVGAVGLSPVKLRRIEAMAEQIRDEPRLLQAMTLAEVLQDVGRRPEAWVGLGGDEVFFHHGVIGGRYLSIHPEIIERLGAEPDVAQTAISLIQSHNLFHHVLFGGAGLTQLAEVTDSGDEGLVTAALLMSVIDVSARDESLVAEYLVDRFLRLYDSALEVMRGSRTWGEVERQWAADRSRMLLAINRYRSAKKQGQTSPSFFDLWEQTPEPDDEFNLAQGRRVLALERLLRLRGLRLVDFADLELYRLGLPLLYLYRRKGLRSVGQAAFEKEVFESHLLYRALRRQDRAVQMAILSRLSQRRPNLRVLGYGQAASFLTYENQIKLLLLGLRAADARVEDETAEFTVDFRGVARVIDWLFEAVNQLLSQISAEELLTDEGLEAVVGGPRGLGLRYHKDAGAVSLTLTDPTPVDKQLAALEQTTDLEELNQSYEQALQDLQLTSTNTLYHQNRLTRAYERHRHRLLEQICQQAGLKMRRTQDFGSLMAVYEATMDRARDAGLTGEQRLLLKDSLELNLERIRNWMVVGIFKQIQAARSRADLEGLWEQIKVVLRQQRDYLGRNVARIVAQKFDARAAELDLAEADLESVAGWDELDEKA